MDDRPVPGKTYRRRDVLGWFGFRKRVVFRSTITCPHCGKVTTEQMPSNACVYFFICTRCQQTVKPLPGKCCVYCSYGTVKCPPAQRGEN